MATMREACILKDASIIFRDQVIPRPGTGEVLIEVAVSGSNPKDYKTYLFPDDKFPLNNGDDIAGTVVEVGEKVDGLKPGDHVVAYHAIGTGPGSWAKYAIAPAYTVATLADSIDFEAAATVPLASMTAALANYHVCQLPEPQSPAVSNMPFLVYGASSAVGSFSVKLAALSNVHPIITVAGAGAEYVSTLLDPRKGDVVIDYRGKTGATLEAEIKAALGGLELKHAFDAVAVGDSLKTTLNVLADNSGSRAALAMPPMFVTPPMPDDFKPREDVIWDVPNSTSIHSGLNGQPKDETAVEFGTKYFSAIIKWLNEGLLTPHPFQIVPGGLHAVEQVLELLQSGKASAKKFVFKPGE